MCLGIRTPGAGTAARDRRRAAVQAHGPTRRRARRARGRGRHRDHLHARQRRPRTRRRRRRRLGVMVGKGEVDRLLSKACYARAVWLGGGIS